MTKRPLVWLAVTLGLLGEFGWWLPDGSREAWGAPATQSDSSFTIPAYAYDRGRNVETCTSGYADAQPLVV